MNEKIQLVFRHYSREHDEALEWLRNNPEAKSILRASTVKKIFRPNGYCGRGSSDFDIALDKDVKVRGADGVTETFSYSQIANELLEELKEEKLLPTEQTDNSPAYISEEIAESFNYALVSVEIGDYLRGKEQQLKNEYMNFTANCGAIFAEAQERLAGSNQYNGLFEKWITAMGFKRDTVYRMINIHKFCSSQIATTEQAELFDSLSKSLQYEIVKPSAPPELVEQVMSGDITTHKEYIALKRQLEEEKRSADEALERAYTAEQKVKKLKEDIEDKKDDIHDLEEQIKELENRPVEVAVAESGSVADAERKFNETLRILNRRISDITEEADRDVAEMRTERNAALDRAEAAEAEIERMKDSKIKNFCIKLSMDDFDGLMTAVKGTKFESIIKNAQILRI